MPQTSQAPIDPDLRDRAGLTVSEAVRLPLTRAANDGALPPGLIADPAAHDAWFRAKIHETRANPVPPIPHAEVQPHLARRRAALRTVKSLFENALWRVRGGRLAAARR